MLNEIFEQILKMSLSGGIAIIFIMIFRLLIKRLPKIFSYALWAVVLFRLLCPINIYSDFSLVGLFSEPIKEITQAKQMTKDELEDIIGEIKTDNIVVSDITPSGTTVTIGETNFSEPTNLTVNKTNIPLVVWLIGIAVIMCCSIYGFIRLKNQLIGAVNSRENIYIADNIPSPFVVGFIFPKIYLPSNLNENESEYVICHEKYHIKRFDHIIKAIAFLTLCLHWFNPLVWSAFILFSKDMEMSCDEAVIKQFGEDIKSDYAKSLLDFSTGKRIYAATPLAFGEESVKTRINNIARMKKPTVIMIVAATIIVLTSTVILITDPMNKQTELLGANYHISECIYNDGEDSAPPVQFCISADYWLYSKETENDAWELLGKLEKEGITKEKTEKYLFDDSAWIKRYNVREIKDSYILRLENNYFYLAILTSSGDTLLCYGWEDISEKDDKYSDDTYIKAMYLLESEFSKNSFNVNFFERSLKYTVGKNIDCFHYYENDKHPGFAVVGFKAGNGSRETMTDLGFAVFSFAENVGYKLIEWHNYVGAAVNGEKIYTCEHPAIFSINGVSNYMNSYDVVLSVSPELYKITRKYRYDGKNDVIVSDLTDGHISMTLFKRTDRDGAVEVTQYYYDEDNNCFGSEDVTVASNFTDISGEKYVSWRSIYMTPFSSFLSINGDSGYRYVVGEDSFSLIPKDNYNITTVNDIKYEWQKLPWTKEEWTEMFILEVPEELSNTETILWQPISDDYFSLECNGKMYISRYIYESVPQRTSIWDIYELIPEEKVGFAEWIYEPYMSHKLPYFMFEFDIPNATHITAICIDGEISNEDESGVNSPADKKYNSDSAIYWSPHSDMVINNNCSEIHFTVSNGEEVMFNGIIYITPGVNKGSYTATIGGHGLCIKNNSEYEGAIISLINE